MILLLILAVPVTAESSTITTISPAVGYTGGSTTVTITGTNFNTSSVKVKLMMDGESNITSTVSSLTGTQIVCKFTISSSKTTGDWDLVVINEDGSEVVNSEGFAIRSPMTLTSISPTDARTNNESVDFTIVGTGLSDVSSAYLYNKKYDNITAGDVDAASSVKVKGTFDLTDATEATYKVCVVDSAGTRECGLSFEITTDAVGSIDISSSPTGATIYLDGSSVGTTPDTVDNLIEGSHKIVLRKSGYDDWGKIVTVTSGDTKTVSADLVAVTTAPTPVWTPEPTPVWTSQPPTMRTTRESTVAVPTSWPSTTTATTTASPIDPTVIIGALGLAFVAPRKH
jgi:hypothetical protein